MIAQTSRSYPANVQSGDGGARVPSRAPGAERCPDKNPEGRIAATSYQAQGVAQRSKAAAALPDGALGAFKVDPDAPIHIEADRLVEVFDGPTDRSEVFTGIVKLQQGVQLRTVSLTDIYSGQSGFSTDGEWRGEQLTREEAKERVLVTVKDGQTATADWATFDVMANTVLMGDDVTVSRGKNVWQGPRLRIDLATGMYRFEIESGPVSPQPPARRTRHAARSAGLHVTYAAPSGG